MTSDETKAKDHLRERLLSEVSALMGGRDLLNGIDNDIQDEISDELEKLIGTVLDEATEFHPSPLPLATRNDVAQRVFQAYRQWSSSTLLITLQKSVGLIFRFAADKGLLAHVTTEHLLQYEQQLYQKLEDNLDRELSNNMRAIPIDIGEEPIPPPS